GVAQPTPSPAGAAPTPTATPTGAVAVRNNSATFLDYDRHLHLLGEVENTGTVAVDGVKVTGTIFDGTSQVGAAVTYARGTTPLVVGERECFEMVYPTTAPVWTRY